MGRNINEYCCIVCGDKSPTSFYSRRKNKCKTCLSFDYKNNIDKEDYIEKQKKWRGNNLIHYRVESAKHRAKRNNLDFQLTDKIIEDKLKEQNNLCYISKQPLSNKENNWNSISLDRLDSELGYTIENTIIVTKFVNNSKNNLSLEEYINLIKLVCDNL